MDRCWGFASWGFAALSIGFVVLTLAAPASASSSAQAGRDVFGTVKSVSGSAIVISHLTTSRAVRFSTLTFSLSGSSISAPNTWVLANDPSLVTLLNQAGSRQALSGISSASTLLSSLGVSSSNQALSTAKVWVDHWGSVSLSYLAAGDTVAGVSALSAAKTARYERTGRPVPLATLKDMTSYGPAPAPTAAQQLESALALAQAEA